MLGGLIRTSPPSSFRWLALLTAAVLGSSRADGQTSLAPAPRGAPSSPGDGGPATDAALTPYAVAVDAAGNVFIADYGNQPATTDGRGNRIRMVAAGTGIISTIADRVFTSGSSVGIAVDPTGNVVVADAQGATVRRVDAGSGVTIAVAGRYWGFSGDGGPAAAAQLDHPFGVAVDGGGNVYIAEWSNNRIRKVTAATGIITTIAGNGSDDFSGDGGSATSAGLPQPSGVAVDRAGNVFIADWANNRVNRVRKITASTGIITTVAGGTGCVPADGVPAAGSCLYAPTGVAVDGAGNVFIVDSQADVIRKIEVETGIIRTVAGVGRNPDRRGFAGDGGPATSAVLNGPSSVAVDREGNLYIADTRNHRVRKVAAATGIITTMAGNGTQSGHEDHRRPREH